MKIFLMLLLAPGFVFAASGGVKLDRAPIDSQDALSIQRGAQVFVNYCLNCHAAQSMRYNRLVDLGLTEEQIEDNLLFANDKVGETMSIAMRGKDAKDWFGVPPPDLSVIARSRSADWLYTYLRTYYRDEKSATGWNNLVFENVGMPHVLYQLQGEQALKVVERDGAHGKEHVRTLALQVPGSLSTLEYDKLVADLVNYLVFMGEPQHAARTRTGYAVLIFLGLLFVIVYALKKEYWKDIH